MSRTSRVETVEMDGEEIENENEEEGMRLKTLAEDKYKKSKLKSALKYANKAQCLCPNLDGITDMVTAFKILHVYSKSSPSSTGPDWYQILEVEPFSHINSIKKHYKKLALILHPDKNACVASEEAFKRVSEAHQLLSDKLKRKDYDLKLRIALQSQATATNTIPAAGVETFWTACSRCQLFHEFDSRYIGHFLRCPSCKRSFLAEQVMFDGAMDDDDDNDVDRVQQNDNGGSRRETKATTSFEKEQSVRRSSRVPIKRKFDYINDLTYSRGKSRSTFSFRSKKVEKRPEMTIAEMQAAAKRRLLEEKAKKEAEKSKAKEKEDRDKNDYVGLKEMESDKTQRQKKQRDRVRNVNVVANFEKNTDMEIMVVEDSDFYDFDKDRKERCFKKAQIWAVYDDDDGMPRNYGLIDEVESVNPFVVKMSWLDTELNGDARLICWEKSGFHISCGRFKVSRKIVVDSVNVFSHLVLCERMAREIYWIYPRKGSIWALYNEKDLNGGERIQMFNGTRRYDIVVSLTSYSEMHGLSMAYLEKVEGYKTIFRRREIGCNAIKWLEKGDLRLFSHQIPSKKLSGSEAHDLPKDCWELDPASLPANMLALGWER